MINSVAPVKKARKKSAAPVHNSWGTSPEGSVVKTLIIEKVIKKIAKQLPGLATVAVVEVATGNCLAHLSRTPGFDAAAVAAHNAALVRQKQLAMAASGMRGERLTDILIPFRKQLHLIRLARGGQWFGYLAVDARDTSLGLAREILQAIIP